MKYDELEPYSSDDPHANLRDAIRERREDLMRLQDEIRVLQNALELVEGAP